MFVMIVVGISVPHNDCNVYSAHITKYGLSIIINDHR